MTQVAGGGWVGGSSCLRHYDVLRTKIDMWLPPKYCNDLAPGCEFSSAKCPIYFDIYGMKLNEGHFWSGNAIIHFWDKPYQEINFKTHLSSVHVVTMEKYCQICAFPI